MHREIGIHVPSYATRFEENQVALVDVKRALEYGFALSHFSIGFVGRNLVSRSHIIYVVGIGKDTKRQSLLTLLQLGQGFAYVFMPLPVRLNNHIKEYPRWSSDMVQILSSEDVPFGRLSKRVSTRTCSE